MRHRIFGRQFDRSSKERRALFRNLIGELIVHGRVKTSIAKAKAIKSLVDKLVTKAKKSTLASRREVLASLPQEAGLRFVDTIVPQIKDRTSGFSRIVRVGQRRGDNTQVVLLEWVEQVAAVALVKPATDKKIAITETQERTETLKKTGTQKKPQRKRLVSQKRS